MSNLSHRSPKTRVNKSPIHGKGLFAVRSIKQGEIVAAKGGHIFNGKTLARVERRVGPAEIMIADDLFIGPVSKRERSGAMLFLNHSCAPNVGIQGQIVMVALRNIRSGEELTIDYAMTDDYGYKMKCDCGAKNCRKIITGRDWKRKDLQKKYKGHFSMFLQMKMQGRK